MKFDEVNKIAKQEVIEFLFSECEWEYDALYDYLVEEDTLPDDVYIWSAFSEYEYAAGALGNLMEGILHTLVSFGSKIGDLK